MDIDYTKERLYMKKYELWYVNEVPFGWENRALFRHGQDIPDDGWEKWSLPIGNGYMGVNVFGRTFTERLQITENSLSNPAIWNAGPGCNGGISNFCELYIDVGHEFSCVNDYRRSLSINDAIARTEYSLNGVRYEREYFTSYPDKVFVTKFSADTKGAVSLKVRPEIPFVGDFLIREGDGMGKSGSVSACDGRITLSGEMHYYAIKFECQISVSAEGGEIFTCEDFVEVRGADSVVIRVAVGTNYKLESRVFLEDDPKKKLAPYEHPHKRVTAILDNALKCGYEELRARHIADYKALFERAFIDLGADIPDAPTDILLENYKSGKRDAYLEEMYFAYGRYLLISSSRPNTYPANLQGTWSQYASSPWSAGYWHNINIQMNYWPSFNTNLHELFIPYIEYYKAYRPFTERIADEYVKEYFPERYSSEHGENGFAIGTAAWLYTLEGPFAPFKGHSGPGTGAFTTKLFTDYLQFTMNKKELLEFTYDANLKMSKFLSKMLEEQDDGKLLVKYSASPEQIVMKNPKTMEESHGSAHYYTKGCAFDQQMVHESYKDTIALADEMGIKDEFVEKIREDILHLDPVQIGASGQIKEFREEEYYGDIGERHHRHISHLVGVYPGTLITQDTNEWKKGAEVALDNRGDDSSGWSTAHKMNVWARLKNGERAYALLGSILTRCTLPNLWDTHPPFQIDGNLGTTAGIAEMLLQSHEGYIHILPALPDAWSDGKFSGLCARGGFSISAEWKNKRLTYIKVLSGAGEDLRIYVGEGYSSGEVKNGFIERKTVPAEEIDISF